MKMMGKISTKALLFSLAALTFAGCGSIKEESNEAVKEEAVTDNSTSAKDADIIDASTTDDTFVAEEYDSADERAVIHTGDHIFSVDHSGKILEDYYAKDFAEACESKGIPDGNSSFLTEKGGIYYYDYTNYNEDKYGILAFDPVSRDVAVVAKFEGFSLWTSFGYYDGFFYANCYVDSKWSSYRITKEKGVLNYVAEADDSYREFYEALNEYGEYVSGRYGECNEEILGRCGFVITDKERKFYKISANGDVKKIESFPEDELITVAAYDKQFVYFYVEIPHEDTSESYLYRMDLEQEKSERLALPDVSDYSITFQDGELYYKSYYPQENGTYTVTLHSYDLETGEDNTIVARDGIPGAGDVYYPLEDCKIKDGKLFFPDFENAEAGWFMADLMDVDNTEALLDMPTVTVNAYKYGRVDRTKTQAVCPNCGIYMETLDAETFVLDEAFSAEADRINDALMGRTLDRVEIISEAQKEYDTNTGDTKGYCDYHSDLWTSDTYTVDDVQIIDDRYLAVYEEYCGDGVGFDPFPVITQYLYDLQTGDQLSILDFYPGTDEELRTFIATKVREDFDSYDAAKSGPYTTDELNVCTSESVFENAHDNFNPQEIFMEEEGIVYNFYPNTWDFYNDNPHVICISYKELLGRPRLGS